jgi:hypothetical protein
MDELTDRDRAQEEDGPLAALLTAIVTAVLTMFYRHGKRWFRGRGSLSARGGWGRRNEWTKV